MDFFELSGRRQSCRKFRREKPVEHEKLVRCVEAAGLAPSACNSQPWKFVIVEDPAVAEKVAACPQQMGINGFASEAGAFAVVLEEHARLMPRIRCVLDSQYFAKGDLGATTACFCLAAEEQGLGTCIMGMFDREKLCQILGLPEEQRIFAMIAIGYPAEEGVRPKKRKPLEEIARFV